MILLTYHRLIGYQTPYGCYHVLYSMTHQCGVDEIQRLQQIPCQSRPSAIWKTSRFHHDQPDQMWLRITLICSQQVAKECHQKEVIVQYDLAIAKPALQIQSTEAPRVHNVFVCFGAFRIKMTYFACLGHFREASGGPQILCDTTIWLKVH